MTPFACTVAFDGAPDDDRFEERAARALGASGRRRIVTRRAANAAFVQLTAAEAGGPPVGPPRADIDTGILFVADTRLDNRAELGVALSLAPRELAAIPDATLILRMYLRWGDAGLARCLGAFAFALWDSTSRRLILARDCLGARALFFHRGRNAVTFASSLGALLALPQVPREVDERTLANFMAINLAEPRRTFYRGIERVPSRTIVTIDRAGIRHGIYWSPDFGAPPPYRRDEDYIERARELFDQAVATATVDTPHVAVSASGGLDSSAVAATAARLGRAERITCYTLVPPPDTVVDVGPMRYLDERGKVEALGRMHPALELRFFTDETVHPSELDDTRLFARAGVPVLGPANLGAFGHIHDAVAAAGHSTMLVGVAGNFGLTWTGQFSLLASLRAGHWLTFARDVGALVHGDGHGFARVIGREVVMPVAPRGIVRLVHRLRGRDPDDVAWYSPLNPAFIAEHGLARRWQEQNFDPWPPPQPGRDLIRTRTHYMFDYNQFGRDIGAEYKRIFGFERRDPHADRRLLEFLLAVPEPMYRRQGVSRSFARAVLADRLPREILEERRSGRQGVAWFHRLSARRQDIADELERLDASPLARRLIDVQRLKRLMASWPSDADDAEEHRHEYRLLLNRGVHVGRFIRWVEGGNA